MMPNSDLVKDVTIEGINLKQLMDDLNRRISVLIDRDHQIGHAYFMHINTLGELKDAWFNKILPLLNEYFYGDWNKLKFIVKTFINEENVPEDLKEEYGDEKLYSFKCETAETDDEFISDLKGLFTK
jgi:5-methylcytosine-specific restriction protein B